MSMLYSLCVDVYDKVYVWMSTLYSLSVEDILKSMCECLLYLAYKVYRVWVSMC